MIKQRLIACVVMILLLVFGVSIFTLVRDLQAQFAWGSRVSIGGSTPNNYADVDPSGNLYTNPAALSSNIDSVTAFAPSYIYNNITSNTTTNVKTSAGFIHVITINTKGASSNTLKLYDCNACTSSGLFATMDTTANVGSTIYDVTFNNGLTVVSATGTACDCTVSYK